MKKKKILITGFNGYIGKNLLKHFKKFNISHKGINLKDLKNNHKNYTHLIHLQFFISKNKNQNYKKKNKIIIRRVIKKCLKDNLFLIFFSTSSADRNINDYTNSKKICEKEINKFSRNKKLKYLILRIYNVYSTDLDSRGVIPDFVNKIKSKKRLSISFSENVRDFIYMDDLLELIRKSTNLKKSMKIQVGTGKGTKISLLAKKIQNKFNPHCEIAFSLIKKSKKNSYSIANISKTTSLLNWKPRTSLNKGINLIYEKNR